MVFLFFLVLIGFIGGKFLDIKKESIARILIYFMTPITVFWGVLNAKSGLMFVSIPLFFFLTCTAICFLSLHLSKLFLKSDKQLRHILAFGAGNANSGYFAIPVGTLIFGEDALSLIVLTSIGFITYEFTVGFFVAARGGYSFRESLRRVVRLPMIYAFALGVACHQLSLKDSFSVLEETIVMVRNCYSVLGMMLIGLGLSTFSVKSKNSLVYIASSQVYKFALWPLFIAIYYKIGVLGEMGFEGSLSQLPFFTGVLPMAANTVAVAAELKGPSDQAALAVLVSTVISWVLISISFSY